MNTLHIRELHSCRLMSALLRPLAIATLIPTPPSRYLWSGAAAVVDVIVLWKLPVPFDSEAALAQLEDVGGAGRHCPSTHPEIVLSNAFTSLFTRYFWSLSTSRC